jgi:hypothetical protein
MGIRHRPISISELELSRQIVTVCGSRIASCAALRLKFLLRDGGAVDEY